MRRACVVPFVVMFAPLLTLLGCSVSVREVVENDCPAEYAIRRGHMTVDLTGYRPRSLLDRITDSHIETLRKVDLEIEPLAVDLDEIRISHSTQGDSIRLRSLSGGLSFEESEECGAPEPESLRYDIYQIGGLGEILARKCLRRYEIVVPATAIRNGSIAYELGYFDGFQNPRNQWAGFKFLADAEQFVIEIVFPEQKGPKAYFPRIGVAAIKTSFRDVEDPEITVAADGSSLKWTVRNAQCGQAAMIRWEW